VIREDAEGVHLDPMDARGDGEHVKEDRVR